MKMTGSVSKIIMLMTALSVTASICVAGTASDLTHMTKARELFGQAKLDEAFKEYEKVPQSSDFWLEAVEEKAHIMGRKKDYAKVIGILQTPLSSAFIGAVGPEPYFVAALTYLKICDYSAVLKMSKQFKQRFTPRLAILSQLEKTGDSISVQELLARAGDKALSFSAIGSLAGQLPRQIQRDQIVAGLVKTKKSVKRDADLKSRIKALAKRDISEISDIVNKLQVIEGEVIQRIHLTEMNDKKRKEQGEFADGKDVLTFPYDGEVWIDELDNYAAKIEKCPDLAKRASL